MRAVFVINGFARAALAKAAVIILRKADDLQGRIGIMVLFKARKDLALYDLIDVFVCKAELIRIPFAVSEAKVLRMVFEIRIARAKNGCKRMGVTGKVFHITAVFIGHSAVRPAR